MQIALKNLLQEKTRLALAVGGIALAVMLILLLNGFLIGMNLQITSYLDNSPGSIIIAQNGVQNLLGATSLLPPGIAIEAYQVEGVIKVVPILSQFVILDLHDKKQPAYLIGYKPDYGGGPWKLAEGRLPKSDTEIVFDNVLAKDHQIKISDLVEILGQEFSVVGLSQGTTSWMTSFFFITKGAAEKLLLIPEATSFLLITPSEDISIFSIQDDLAELKGVDALLKTTVAQNDLNLFAKIFSGPLRLMVAISFFIGALIVGLIIYTMTIERQQEYGVLKAVGAKNINLYKIVISQALIAGGAGTILGVIFSYLVSSIIMVMKPQFLIVYYPLTIIWAIFGGLVMAIVGAFIPAWIVSNLSPAEVFRK